MDGTSTYPPFLSPPLRAPSSAGRLPGTSSSLFTSWGLFFQGGQAGLGGLIGLPPSNDLNPNLLDPNLGPTELKVLSHSDSEESDHSTLATDGMDSVPPSPPTGAPPPPPAIFPTTAVWGGPSRGKGKFSSSDPTSCDEIEGTGTYYGRRGTRGTGAFLFDEKQKSPHEVCVHTGSTRLSSLS